MHSGKKTTPFSFLLKAAFLLGFSVFGFLNKAQAQADDLMIVEYVDWNTGAGFAIKIYNPTPNPVNLTNYRFRIYGNGSGDINNPDTDSPLKGTLQPCGFIVIGNDLYVSSNCPGSANVNNFTSFADGVNGNDIVAITSANGTLIDAIGRIGYNPGSNGLSQNIGGTTNALFEKKIRRNPTNLARYTLSTGTYNPAIIDGPNIWPNDRTTSVQGWTVVGNGSGSAGCLAPGLPTGWILPTLTTPSVPKTITSTCKMLAPQGIAISLSSPTDYILTGGTGLPAVSWSGGAGTFDNLTGLATTYRPSPADPAVITLQAVITFGCRKEILVVTINNGTTVAPTVTANNVTNDCRQDSIRLEALPNALTNFEWKTSNGKGTFRNKNATTTYYKVAANDFSQLKFTANVTSACFPAVVVPVTVQNGRDTLQSATGITANPQNVLINQPVTLNYTTTRPQTDHYGIWNYGDGIVTDTLQGSQLHAFSKPGIYTVSVDVVDAFDCPKGRFTQQITVTEPANPVAEIIPNIFTPNNDNVNDTFKPQLPATSSYEVKIYNRWGTLVFETTDPGKAWDGKDAADGVYFVYLKASLASGETREVRMPLTLVR